MQTFIDVSMCLVLALMLWFVLEGFIEIWRDRK